jgi:hypothetical protein
MPLFGCVQMESSPRLLFTIVFHGKKVEKKQKLFFPPKKYQENVNSEEEQDQLTSSHNFRVALSFGNFHNLPLKCFFLLLPLFFSTAQIGQKVQQQSNFFHKT